MPRLAPLLVCLALAASSPVRGQEGKLPPPAAHPVDFAKEVQPLLARGCLGCHGPKKQEGGLRLHAKAAALAGGDDGPVIVPGKSAESRLIQYVAGLDEDRMMPPEGAGRPLNAVEIGLLRAWIDQGAAWPEEGTAAASPLAHWAFRKPVRPATPAVRDDAWCRNAIDRFILARLEKEGLAPAPEADRATLIRRLSLDLIGLPPTIAELDAFLADTRPDAYERLVDRLLASPHHGERWGRRWLDRARYADTNGYEKDRERSIWPYRDWVITALNDDMPFDRFTIEQLAGDLLPGATVAQRVATGFHRNTMINEEGGIDVEEFRYASLVDRVHTTGAVWLGLTIGCAQCHSHKYDPISQREYYQFLAFFNNADEPEEAIPSPEGQRSQAAIDSQIAAIENDLENRFPLSDEAAGWVALTPLEAKSASGADLTIKPDDSLLASGASPATDTYRITFTNLPAGLTALRLETLTDPSLPGQGPGRAANGNFVVNELAAELVPSSGGPAQPVAFVSATADTSQSGFAVTGAIDGDPATGWAIDDGSGKLNKDRAAVFAIRADTRVTEGSRLVVTLSQMHGGGHVLGRLRLSAKPPAIPAVAALPEAERRRLHVEDRMAAWERQARARSVEWNTVAPTRYVSRKSATLSVLPDLSVLATGDKPNNDVYELDLPLPATGATAIRLEVLPHESLPDGGPGRAPLFSVGDFILTEVEAAISGADGARPVRLRHATQDYSEPNRPAALAIDGVTDTGWTVKGAIGQPHAAVFECAEPLPGGLGAVLKLTLHQFGIHQMTLGRFRVSLTSAPPPIEASGLPAEIEAIVLVPRERRTAEEQGQLKRHFLATAPELKGEHDRIAALRRSRPRGPTSMTMRERSAEHQRATHIHKRGEFLQLGDRVGPGVPAVFPPCPPTPPATGSRWLAGSSQRRTR